MNTILFPHDFDYPSLLKGKSHRFALVTDLHVAQLIGKQLEQQLNREGLPTVLIAFPPGEGSKTRETKQWVEDQMLAANMGRDCCILALGGGVVTDLAGYVAATYCRGIPFFSIPTTLMGMVDAALGGKTGVNTRYGKNLIGAFYPPQAVLIQVDYLRTLPKKELKNGIAEILKHGLISSEALVERMERGALEWEKRDPSFLEEIIRWSCAIKMGIVSQDPFEKGVRRTLNFGHTIGHALEVVESYQLPHGIAVGIGISLETQISAAMGYLDWKHLERIYTLLHLYELPLKPDKPVSREKFKEALALDKKGAASKIRSVILNGVGSVEPFGGEYCSWLTEEVINALPLY